MHKHTQKFVQQFPVMGCKTAASKYFYLRKEVNRDQETLELL